MEKELVDIVQSYIQFWAVAVIPPDGSWEETVLQPGCSGCDATQPPAREKGGKQSVCRVGEILHNAGSPNYTPAGVDIDSHEAAPCDFLCSFNHPLQGFPVRSRAVPIPHSDTQGKDVLHRTSIKASEDRCI